jgi:signal transduction histidine kinase
MINGRSRSSPGAGAGVGTLAAAPVREDGRTAAREPVRPDPPAVPETAGEHALWKRRLRHDIRHELGTIIMLASAVVVAEDVGDGSRARIEQLLGETRWLDHLLRRLDEDDDDQPMPSPERIRVDELTAEVVTGMRLATPHEVCFAGGEAWAHMDPVALWRAVRNVLDNACRVAEGRVNVHVEADQGWVVIQVDDDGPGFGAGPGGSGARRGLASLGLGIVHDLISGYGGSLEIRTCEMGGARVRMLLPSAPPLRDPAPLEQAPLDQASPGEASHDAAPHADDWRPHP